MLLCYTPALAQPVAYTLDLHSEVTLPDQSKVELTHAVVLSPGEGKSISQSNSSASGSEKFQIEIEHGDLTAANFMPLKIHLVFQGKGRSLERDLEFMALLGRPLLVRDGNRGDQIEVDVRFYPAK